MAVKSSLTMMRPQVIRPSSGTQTGMRKSGRKSGFAQDSTAATRLRKP